MNVLDIVSVKGVGNRNVFTGGAVLFSLFCARLSVITVYVMTDLILFLVLYAQNYYFHCKDEETVSERLRTSFSFPANKWQNCSLVSDPKILNSDIFVVQQGFMLEQLFYS